MAQQYELGMQQRGALNSGRWQRVLRSPIPLDAQRFRGQGQGTRGAVHMWLGVGE